MVELGCPMMQLLQEIPEVSSPHDKTHFDSVIVHLPQGYRWTPREVHMDQHSLYLFGDNVIRKGGGGQAVIRYCPNTYGIPTKRVPSMNPDAFFRDDEIGSLMPHIQKWCDGLRCTMSKMVPDKNGRPVFLYHRLVVPGDGIGKGFAKMDTLAPKAFAFLVSCLRTTFHAIREDRKCILKDQVSRKHESVKV